MRDFMAIEHVVFGFRFLWEGCIGLEVHIEDVSDQLDGEVGIKKVDQQEYVVDVHFKV